MQDYRHLRVWRRAHAHVLNVRRATNGFPRTGYPSTKDQLIKTAESVAFTLVEGCGAFTQKEMARFVEMSIKSTKELEYQLFLARDYGVLPRKDWKSLTLERSRSDECFVDYVEGFWETMIRKRCDASSRQRYSKRRTEKLKSPDPQTEHAIKSFGPPYPDISRRTRTSIRIRNS